MHEGGDGFQRLCHEAVLACGSDMSAVEHYIFDRMSDMDAAERDRIKRDIARLFAFQPPAARPVYAH